MSAPSARGTVSVPPAGRKSSENTWTEAGRGGALAVLLRGRASRKPREPSKDFIWGELCFTLLFICF